MQSRIEEIGEAGGEVIAITSDPIDRAQAMARRLPGIRFLHDPQIGVARLYGVADLDAVAPVENPIARPASFLVGRDGVVAWRHLTDNWRVRPRVEEVLGRMREIP